MEASFTEELKKVGSANHFIHGQLRRQVKIPLDIIDELSWEIAIQARSLASSSLEAYFVVDIVGERVDDEDGNAEKEFIEFPGLSETSSEEHFCEFTGLRETSSEEDVNGEAKVVEGEYGDETELLRRVEATLEDYLSRPAVSSAVDAILQEWERGVNLRGQEEVVSHVCTSKIDGDMR
ncbi:hypothetical protein AMTR_s00032p00161260 [Amborella trichopoda]|uniref:Uncharacterized protein n=1 Tax=Amborella trichopoda TaxID=13333 RepID=U5CXK0_AMBTC|nr:hypothetical protein AMTR_s00032p00161260 [Amborella trichopoda]